ncbi:hypothetical protein HJG60_011864 [Phyllostomus discolor]|uniref:Uncharacterized protein n=1 Tax=Phyllostomus discolor TaxID=89673 RepID=A0A834DW07_9CHIR|nr:hypothetical protein HJG60_011864 [Phyllostomus discolor]
MLSYSHSKHLLFSLRLGFGVGSVSVMEAGQPRALPWRAGQSGPGCKRAQNLERRARGCECGSPPPAQLLLAADCGFAITEHAANYNQTMSNHSPAGGLALVRGLAGFSLELPCPLKANGALNSSSLSSSPSPPSAARAYLAPDVHALGSMLQGGVEGRTLFLPSGSNLSSPPVSSLSGIKKLRPL